MLLLILPFLQAIAACITIAGLFNAPAVGDVVVTYGASGPDAPTAMEWVQSFGAIAVGVGGFIGSTIAQYKLGGKSDLYQSVLAFIKAPTQPISMLRVLFSILTILNDKYVVNGDDNAKDAEAIEFMRQWAMSKLTAEPNPLKLK